MLDLIRKITERYSATLTFLQRQWKFGSEANGESDDGGAEDSDGDDCDMVDLVNIEGRVVMRGLVLPGR